MSDLLQKLKRSRLKPLMHGLFLPFTKITPKATHTGKLLTFPNFLLRMPLSWKRSKNFVLPPLILHFCFGSVKIVELKEEICTASIYGNLPFIGTILRENNTSFTVYNFPTNFKDNLSSLAPLDRWSSNIEISGFHLWQR